MTEALGHGHLTTCSGVLYGNEEAVLVPAARVHVTAVLPRQYGRRAWIDSNLS